MTPTPACASISSLLFVEVTIASDAQLGERELRLATPRGVSNPLMFHVGQLPEFSRKPMITATLQVLGKEGLALRKRPDDEVEDRITVPSSVSLRSKSTAAVSLAIRKDGFTSPIKLGLKDPPAGFSASSVTLSGTQADARLTVKTDLVATKKPVTLSIVGSAKIENRELAHEAVPAEDRMQAFLWRHLVPAQDLKVAECDAAQ